MRFTINKERFDYVNNGLPLHESTEQNFQALAVVFKTRSENAAEGRGIGQLFDGAAETRFQVASEGAYENLFRWELQMLLNQS